MKIQAIKTRKVIPPKDDLWEVLEAMVPKVQENSIVAITSKIVSIGEGSCVRIDQVKDKDQLIKQEADRYLPRELAPHSWVMLTVKNNTLIPTAGIDESNSKGYFTLWPKDPDASAKKIWQFLRKKSKVKNLGVIITDSHTIPLRWGVIGISVAHFGFKPLIDYRGKEDLFGRELKITKANIPDSLAAAAVFTMGEGAEQTPVAIISELEGKVKFVNKMKKPKSYLEGFYIPLEYDLYKPLIESVPWKKGKSGQVR